MLLSSLANKIINQVRKLTKEQLIITDQDGQIIASTLKERIGQFHEGALLACNNKETVRITPENEKQFKGEVKAGLCLPIFFHQEAVGAIGITGHPESIEEYGELLKKMTELLIQESYYYDQNEWMQRAYETFLFDWLNNEEWTEDFYKRADVLHIDLTTKKQVIMISFESPHVSNAHHLLADLKNLFQTDGKLILRWGHGKFVMIHNVNIKEKTQELKGFLEQILHYCLHYYRMEVRIGVGHIVPSTHIKESFTFAERALKVTSLERPIVFEDELGLEICLQEVHTKTKKQLIHRVLGKIVQEKELLETLRTLLQCNHSLKETAQTLHIHINTLHYRLKKIEELTGYNPRVMKDIVTLYIAMQFLCEHPININEND
ncbi:sugar diacid recognition domain-containing protein [Bacillus sp. FJAT-47783]|uniref:CdaR family transcriptional regulator n=1 Tax=Bacillus sp. FJAT-47783 TaxID=2922712 RepID=UPI001FACB7D7|nr:sugar diacid recognition domain-containing protein [Bacillus sp. FJAT-47783]